jgi:lysophospholipase L1-like esterase
MMHGPAGRPANVVINLGTNDVLQGNRHWHSDWNRLLSDASTAHCEVLFTLNDFIDAYRRPGGATAEEFNRVIDQVRAADPSRVHVIDWNAAVEANHRAIAAAQLRRGVLPAPLIRGDGVHPAAAGQEWIARHIASTLDDWCRG